MHKHMTAFFFLPYLYTVIQCKVTHFCFLLFSPIPRTMTTNTMLATITTITMNAAIPAAIPTICSPERPESACTITVVIVGRGSVVGSLQAVGAVNESILISQKSAMDNRLPWTTTDAEPLVIHSVRID